MIVINFSKNYLRYKLFLIDLSFDLGKLFFMDLGLLSLYSQLALIMTIFFSSSWIIIYLSFVNFYRIFRCDSWYKIHIYTYILVLCYLHFAMLWWLKQRLEFLGDAVLDYLITSYLYSVYPKLKPGQLTDLRSVSVNNNSFADVAVYRSFHKYILCDSISLCESMNKYVNFVEKSVSEEGLVEAPCPKVVNVKS